MYTYEEIRKELDEIASDKDYKRLADRANEILYASQS